MNKKRKWIEGKPSKDRWKKKFKRALKTQSGISHVMSVMCEEENKNAPLVSTLQPHIPTPMHTSVPLAPSTTLLTIANISELAGAFPKLSTKIKLNTILKNGS